MKFKSKTKDCHLVVRAKASFGESIDEYELDKFARVYLRGFLKPKLIKKNLVEYTGPIGISLYERLQKPITKRDFLFVIEQIVVAIQKLQANHMPLNNLITDIQNIYINEVTKEVQFIYVPMVAMQSDTAVLELLEPIIYSAKPAEQKDSEFISSFVYFLKSLNPFDISQVEAEIAREDRNVVNTIKKQNAGQSGFMTNKQQHYYDHYNRNDGISCDSEETGLLEEDDEATDLLVEEEEGTCLLEENQGNVRFPTLFRVLTEETIFVNKPVFRLGKEKSYVDYFVTNNVAVSRSHADIINRNNSFFVKDLNSKNHTYINDQELPVLCEVEIHDGDRLKLGNEEFIFNA